MSQPSEASPLRDTVAARVAEQLRLEIQRGDLTAGTPLRQNDLAMRLGVSSTPVREAFQILERSGLVVREGRRGVRVFHPHVDDLVNGYEVRGVLEPLAARLAAQRLSADELSEISSTMERMHSPDVSQESFLRLNAQFHAQIARGSGNSRLCDLIVTEQTATTSYVFFLGVDPSGAKEAHGEHAAVLDAIAARDADAAAAAMTTHLTTRVDALRARLDARSGTRPG